MGSMIRMCMSLRLAWVRTSRSASAYDDMSVKMTRTCFSNWYAKYSAVVNARRGVMIRSILIARMTLAYAKGRNAFTHVGSLAKFMNNVTRSKLPFSSKSCLKNRAVSMLTPMAPKTMLKLSS